ncbi:MAG: nitrate reductase [Pirellulaceae bacterium]|nr:MAG: nitrate reductase [Pirellulaceae bacterium]
MADSDSAHRLAGRLPPGQQWVAAGKWPLVGEKAPVALPDPWTVAVIGCVDQPRVWTLDELRRLPYVERTVDIHCVTRWSRPDVRFGGVLLADLVQTSRPTSQARYVSFLALSSRRHSTSLAWDEACRLGVLVAWQVDGRPLPVEHGGPVRIVTPQRYFYKSLKWLAVIELLAEDRLGFWESTAGYHNQADPWQEQRFIAGRLTKPQMSRLLATRDWSNNEWFSVEAAGRDLSGLNAQSAILRNADFRQARLVAARFDRANLSGARFQGADLRGASFRDADVEGAHFEGADLRGADFQGASLLGATFVALSVPESTGAARLDQSTRFSRASLELLVPEQARFVAAQARLSDP